MKLVKLWLHKGRPVWVNADLITVVEEVDNYDPNGDPEECSPWKYEVRARHNQAIQYFSNTVVEELS